jgi:transcriptional antiterminator NusG
MTTNPDITTDDPDAPAADTAAADAADAGAPAPISEDVPTEASARDADAAAAAAALFGLDAAAPAADAEADADAGLSAAEREYQEAMRAARALGFDEEAPTAPIDEEAATAERLAEHLGLEDAPPPPPAEPDAAAELAAAEADEILGPAAGDGRAWYVLNTYSGHENKVDENLKRRVESMDVADRIFDVIVPTEEELEIRGGQRRQVQRKLLPGYVLVNMILDDDTWYVVRNTPGVTGFVGAEKPHPLPREEVAAILKQTRVAEPRVRVGFEIGDMVRVMEGPFQDFSGAVDEINVEKGKVRVMISMFGRDTPVELDFMQVEKV